MDAVEQTTLEDERKVLDGVPSSEPMTVENPSSKEDDKSKFKFPNLGKDELNNLARDIAMNLVFVSDFIKEPNMIGSIFMPLMFGAMSNYSESQIKDVGFIYEYLAKAGPMSVNGYPIFFSCGFVSKADAKKIWAKVDKIRKVIGDVCPEND